MFVHQDGVLLCPTIWALSELGILERSLGGALPVSELFPDVTDTGFGYMRVGLRCMASQGWLESGPARDPDTSVVRWTEAGRAVARYFHHYVAAGRLLAQFGSNAPDAWCQPWNGMQVRSFLDLVDHACDRWAIDSDLPPAQRRLTTAHLDSALVVPAMLWLRGAGMLAESGPSFPDTELGHGVARLFIALGWVDRAARKWSSIGGEAARLSVHFGMAASYLPLLSRLPELYRGDVIVPSSPDEGEWHVHRPLNVGASAAAHTRYFADADSIFLELFNREPVEDQPRFVADMGCGDGSWLVHLHRLISERTLRGRSGNEPVLMVGLDYNATALEQARRVVDAAGAPALLILGDISDPSALAATLAEHGLAIEDGLHIRAFIDHDRTYAGGDASIPVRGWSSGAYVDGDGRALDGAAVERDLVAHLGRWAAHVGKHGLVMLEAHCVDPRIARKHLGATHCVAFDAYHGYSHQYPIDHSAFLQCCRLAGLRPASQCERRYPATRPFVAVSLNRLLVPGRGAPMPAIDPSAERRDTWRPDPATDLEDGTALHELLYDSGDIRFPRTWCSAATGVVVGGTLEAVEERLATARSGEVIRVLDYGAGTGLASIEFLKACQERDIERRLEQTGVTLEVHLADLPSSWFAKGFGLLCDCKWTRFHSLRAREAGFRPLLEVTGGRTMDIVIANMVFHLIPERALSQVASELASVTRPGGRLLWNSPDLGPPDKYTVLFHDPNRLLRKRWVQLLRGESSLEEVASRNGHFAEPRPSWFYETIAEVREVTTAEKLREAQARADRRVLPQANPGSKVADALDAAFGGEAYVDHQGYELLADDVVDTLLVPSNQAEYLAEVEDRDSREAIIRDLMLNSVVPEMQAQEAGTAQGVNVQWTLGAVVRSS